MLSHFEKEQVYSLAKELFLRTDKPGKLNNANKEQFEKSMIICIETAKLFLQTFKEETKEEPKSIVPYYGD
jgi:hypothetical protein